MPMKGTFITFEGIEGCGKTTQIKLLAEALRGDGRDIVLTREPGGTTIGERIRSVLLDSAHRQMAPIAELLLYAAARNQHVEEVIMPSLEAGKTVLCDRYADATTAYQGAAREIDPEVLRAVHDVATEGLWPGLTVLLDLPASEGLGRAMDRNLRDAEASREDRFEREALDFHERVRAGYLAIAKREPKRFAVIDATGSTEEVHERILSAVKSFFATHNSQLTTHNN
jgi:dTMP kinase